MATHRILLLSRAVVLLATAGALRAQQPPASPVAPGTPAPTLDSAVRDSAPSVLIGRVTDGVGAGLPGAEITSTKSDKVHAVSGDSGEFRMAGLPYGTIVFNVRRIGYEAATFTAVLRPGKTHRANFKLTVAPQALPVVAVSDTATKSHWLDTFLNRKSGSRGTFITRPEIVKRGARTGTDIVRTVPGVRVDLGRSGFGSRVTMTRGSGARACFPSMFVHGMPYSGTLDDFTADDIEALEVYVGISEIPPELDKNGRGICGAIVIWTRDPRRAP